MQRYGWLSRNGAVIFGDFDEGPYVEYADAEAYAEEKAQERAREVVEYIEAAYQHRRGNQLAAHAHAMAIEGAKEVFAIRSRGAGPAPKLEKLDTESFWRPGSETIIKKINEIIDAIRALQERG